MTIALVNDAGLDPSQLSIVIQQVERIWGREGLVFSWLHDGEIAEGALSIVIQPGELDRPSQGWQHVLGSIPVSDGHALPKITISLGSVRSLMTGAVVQGRPLSQRPARMRQELEAQVLGRVIAHEIGHYRLRFYGHTASGLMRAVFSTDELLYPGVSRFRLDSSLLRSASDTTRNRGHLLDCRR